MKATQHEQRLDRHGAHTLNEALPYLQRYEGATVVIKFGGNAMGDRRRDGTASHVTSC